MPVPLVIVTLVVSLLATAASARAQSASPPAIDARPARPGEWGHRPADGGPADRNPPAFSWRPQATRKASPEYQLELSRSESFDDVAYASGWIHFNVHCPPQALDSGQWYWRFRYRVAADTSRWSRTRTFAIADNTPKVVIPTYATLRGRIPTTHPRLFVRPEQLPEFRELAKGALRDELAAIERHCDRLLVKPPDTTEPLKYPHGVERKSEAWRKLWWGNRRATIAVLDSAARLAFAYQLTGKPEYRALAKRLLLQAVEWDPRGATGYRYNDEAGMPYNYLFSRTYTFLHDELSEAERARCCEVMRIRGREMYQHLCPGHLWQPYSSHSNRAWHFLGEVAIAFHGEIDEADAWLEFAMTTFNNTYPVWSDADGGWHEGLAYWNSYLGRFTTWADVMNVAVGVDAYQLPFFRHTGDYALYIAPPGVPAGGFGDQNTVVHPKSLARLMGALASQSGNPYWQWYVEQLPRASRWPGYIAFPRASRRKIASQAPTSLPRSRCFEGIGVVAMHDTLLSARDDVELLFKSSPFGSQSHGYDAQNSFVLYAFGERLLIRSGKRDIYGSAHHRHWMWETKSCNNITIGGVGQRPHSASADGRVAEFHDSSWLDYTKGVVEDCYRGRVRRFVRRILFLKASAILVIDDVELNEAQPIEWHLHGVEPFDIVGPTAITATSRDARCAIQFLWPNDLAVTQTDRFDPPPRPRVELVQHHLTAVSAPNGNKARFVTLLRPYRAQSPRPESASVVALPQGLVCRIPDGDSVARVWIPDDAAVPLGFMGNVCSGELLVVDGRGNEFAR